MRRLILGVLALSLLLLATAAGALYWFLAGDGVRLSLEEQGRSWLGQPVHIGSVTAQIYPRIGVRLRDVRIGEPAQLSLADVGLSAGLRPLLAGRLEDADVVIADSRVDMPLPFEIPGGATAGETAAGSDFRVVAVRSIALRDIRITSRGREIVVSADSALAGARLTMTSFSAASRNTTIRGSGTIELAPTLDAQLKMTANQLNLDDLVALAEAFAPDAGTRGSSTAGAGRIVAQIGADSVTVAGLIVPQFTATARVQGHRVSLSPIRFLLFGGRYEGDLDIDLRDAATMTLASRVRDIDVAQLAAFGGVPDTITGRLTGAGTFSGRGTGVAEILTSAKGEGDATIASGTIPRLNLVRTVVLFFGRPAPDATAGDDAFERIDASFSLARRVVTADVLSLRSSNADIVARGSLSLETKALDGRADLSLSEALSAQAGADLYRYTREGNRIVLPATFGGTLAAPRLSIDAGAALSRGLRNEVERRLKGLLDRFRPSN